MFRLELARLLHCLLLGTHVGMLRSAKAKGFSKPPHPQICLGLLRRGVGCNFQPFLSYESSVEGLKSKPSTASWASQTEQSHMTDEHIDCLSISSWRPYYPDLGQLQSVSQQEPGLLHMTVVNIHYPSGEFEFRSLHSGA